MISLRNALESADRLDQQKRKLVGYYLSAIDICSKHALEIPVDSKAAVAEAGALGRDAETLQNARRAGDQLKALHDALAANSSSESLEKSLDEFDRCVGGYNDDLRSALAGANQDVRLMLELLRDVTHAVESSNHRVGSDLTDFTSGIQETIETNDPSRIRGVLSEQILRMKNWVASLRAETEQQLAPLQAQLRAFEERLENAEYLASTDPLTKLWNRREGERLVQVRTVKERPFSLLVIDLNRFKFINDEYGHQCGDQILKFVSTKLTESVRPTDTVCRWGGDEFVVLLDCTLENARRRAAQLADQIDGHFLFESESKISAVPVSASIGVASYQPGDAFDDVFHRADLEMYQQKKSRAAVFPADFDPNRASVYSKV